MELISLREAAQRLGITPDTLRAQIHRGRLHAIKPGRDWLLEDAELERYRRVSHGARVRQAERSTALAADRPSTDSTE